MCSNENSEARTTTQIRVFSRARSKKYREHAFSVMILSLWNDLHIKMNQANTLDIFKSRVKTHLFKRVYYSVDIEEVHEVRYCF